MLTIRFCDRSGFQELLKLGHEEPCNFCPGLLEHCLWSPEPPCRKSDYPETAMLERPWVGKLADSLS